MRVKKRYTLWIVLVLLFISINILLLTLPFDKDSIIANFLIITRYVMIFFGIFIVGSNVNLANMPFNKNKILKILYRVTDPEIPVLSLQDLGVIRDIKIFFNTIIITITPTYSGCPAMEVMENDIKKVLSDNFKQEIKVVTQLSPAWTTDWITDKGKKTLFEYGIMPPSEKGEIICPQCRSKQVELISQFGSTACKALYRCVDCLEPFDYFKCH